MTGDIRSLATGLFRERFGRAPRALAVAPGRVNLIGEHTDYSGGHVLPMAVDRHVVVAFDAAGGQASRFCSADFPEMAEFDQRAPSSCGAGHWTNYVMGPAGVFSSQGRDIPAIDAAVAADLPKGAGLSSSAALEVASGLAFLSTAGCAGEVSPRSLALACQEAEHRYAGVKCGIMDQLSVACAEDGKAMYIDCHNLFVKTVELPAAMAVLVVDSGVPRKLAEAAYNQRREDCESAARKLSKELGRRVRLAEVTHDELNEFGRSALDKTELRRARHVVGEELRSSRAVDCLRRGDLEAFGELARESHRSLAEDFEVSCPELDKLVAAACRIEGVFGARLTGAGFGGAAVVFCRADGVGPISAELTAAYRARTGIETRPVLVRPSAGARVEQLR
ncbi:MAG TPA: galactokinase [Planctomycetota bacterium]|nr:galactokinase [Planctomycetota bacterium]